MCGICGYIHLDESKRPQEAVIKNMMGTLFLRGPDDEGFYLKDNVVLGHRRLSIIDLETGHQPMFNEDGSVAIVYNGEIYNFQEIKIILEKKGHSFSTHSDTEVIIHSYEEYGEGCLRYFNGMFAFAIWDSRKKSLFLARDRFGKKPLYYASFDNQFIFASELKAILKHPSVKREIDTSALAKYLAYEYVPSPYSIFKNIKKLEAGHRLSLKDGKARTERYWDADLKHSVPLDEEELEERLVELLRESVKKRLVSDVPLGVFLSGGIDSSSIVSMMSELMNPKEIKTFSIGFREKSFDESSDARLVADYFGTDHHEEIVKPDAMLEALPKIIELLDEPFADSSIIPTYIVSRFTRKHVKVALGGDGGDELFLGYPSFFAHKIASLSLPFKILSRLAPRSHSYARRFFRGLNFPESVRHQVWIGTFTPDEEKRLFLSNKGIIYDPVNIYEPTNNFFEEVRSQDALSRAMYVYLKTYMTDDILTKVDRASMANSLEVRAPFLDMEFASFAMALPPALKLRNFGSKWILRHALRDKLPRNTLRKPKHGFAVPVERWLKADLRGLLFDAFDKAKIDRQDIFSCTYIQNLLKDFTEERRDVKKEVWALFMFEMWYNKWMN